MALTREPGELVSREALQAELWPAPSQVEWEQGLNAAVNRLREALGDSAAEPRYIETLPRRGYRFIGRLLPEESSPTDPSNPAHTGQKAFTRNHGLLLGGLVGGIVLAAVLAMTLLPARGPEPQARTRPFTSLPGEERGPSFSPDGTRIAFAWRRDASGFDLYAKAMDSERLLRLTDKPSAWLSAAWSPDGAHIAFTRKRDDEQGIFLVPAMGGAERRLTTASFGSEAFMQLSWSPDGGSLAYATVDGDGSHVIRLLDLATLESRALVGAPRCWNAALPAFSADGKRLGFVCTSAVGVFNLQVHDLANGGFRTVASFLGEPQGLTWEQRGDSLILASDSGEGGALWRVSVDGKSTRLPFGEEGSAPTRVGDTLAYVRSRAPINIWRLDLNAADPASTAQKFVDSTRRDVTPQFSADGSRVVFQSDRSGSTEIWVADADGQNPLRITEFGGPLAGAPVFCDDGKRVAFDARVGGNPQIFTVDVDERRPRQVNGGQPALSLPAWSADCEWLLASDGREKLFKLPAAGGQAELFTSRPAYYANVVGERVLFAAKQDTGVELWARPFDGGEEVRIEGLPLIGYNEAWTATAAGVYFTSSQEGRPELKFFDIATREIRHLTTLPRRPWPGGGLGISVSRDGRWLLYTQAGEAESDILLVEKSPD